MSRTTRREFLEESLLAAAAAAVAPGLGQAQAQEQKDKPLIKHEDALRIGVIGVRGRGRGHVGAYKRSRNAIVAAICDADEGVIGRAMRAAPKAKYHRDVRSLLDDDSIDAVSIATPNHWHSLAAIWALQAGKHVYVEKPISHNVTEGRRLVEAAAKYGKIVQHGTQGRSMKATRDAIEWLRGGGLGTVQLARGLCYKRRESIGKVDGPQEPPASCDYDLWTGPAEMKPLLRKNLHYDWHWVFETGNGDIGNQGAHQMDIARWGLGKDEHPHRILSCGGRLGYDDDGTTPNTQIALFDYGDRSLIFEVRGLKTAPYKATKIGVVFHCEHGYLVVGSYTKVVAFDLDGKVVKVFTGAGSHFENFLAAAMSGKRDLLTADCLDGHLSASLCHLANISYRLGKWQKLAATDTPFGANEATNESFRRMRSHLVENGVDARHTDYSRGAELAFDPERERFAGEGSAAADALLTRVYRKPFVVPEKA